MGQYYTPILLDKNDKFLKAYRLEWLKLMECSWLPNDQVNYIAQQCMTPRKVVWAGDYADPEPGSDDNLYTRYSSKEERLPIPDKLTIPIPKLLINLTKKEFVKTSKCKKNADGWIIHPLPLLTAEGNGNGAGDYGGRNIEYAGRWARDLITVEYSDHCPLDSFTEIIPDFMEE